MAVSQVASPQRSLRYLKGVGPQRFARLNQLGLDTVQDLCLYAPRRYEDRSHLAMIRELRAGEWAVVRGTVLAAGVRRGRRRQTIVEAAVGDRSGVLRCLWFHQPYLAQQLKVGQDVVLYGQPEAGARMQMIHPELERVEPDEEPSSDQASSWGESLHMGRIVPVYSLVGGLTQRWFRRLVATVLEAVADTLEDPLPVPLRELHEWPEVSSAVRQLHFPPAWPALESARQRLAFDELLLLQLGLAQRRARTVSVQKPQRYQLEGPCTQVLRQQLPFQLTSGQQRALHDLLADLARPYPMSRLLQGDVGCGKTIVMLWLVAAAVQSDGQVAIMAPTELLAEQHARTARHLFKSLDISITLLTHGVPATQRHRLITEVAAGRINVVIGTQALLQPDVTFRRLALVIIDEQHKFGVVQRAQLAKKGAAPDVLVVTATPIPRTLALTVYGDLEISTIPDQPPGRAPIITRCVAEAQREQAYANVREQLARGRQGYVVYPLVDAASETSSATKELRAATAMAKQLRDEIFPECRIGLLHGQMRPKEKERIMQAFVSGEIQLLVSTVIVEVGLDVPNATVMVIEHPDRFGLAQLHQLRGRIGRSHDPACCWLVTGEVDDDIGQRLRAFVQTTDGFVLAEHDLDQRGPGHLRGSQQHGWIRFRIADFMKDRALLELARDEATRLLRHDPQLRNPEYRVLRQQLSRPGS